MFLITFTDSFLGHHKSVNKGYFATAKPDFPRNSSSSCSSFLTAVQVHPDSKITRFAMSTS